MVRARQVDTSSVSRLVACFTDGYSPTLELPMLHQAYAGDFQSPARKWGGWGLVPIGGFPNGDITALAPVLATPITAWPVVVCSHQGDPGKCFASSLRTYVAAHLGLYERDREVLIERRREILTFAEFLRDDEGRAAAVLEAILADALPESDGEKYRLFEGAGSLLAEYHATPDWGEFTRRFPRFSRGHYRFFEAQAGANAPGALETAWLVVNLDLQFDGEIDTAKGAAKFLVRADTTHASDPRWPAVTAMAADAPCGRKWLSAAQALEKNDPAAAYAAYKNTAFWFRLEMQATPSVTWQGGRRCAKALRDENIEAVFDTLKAPEHEDLDALLARYQDAESRMLVE